MQRDREEDGEHPRRRVILMGNDDELNLAVRGHIERDFASVFEVVAYGEHTYKDLMGQLPDAYPDDTPVHRVSRFTAQQVFRTFPSPLIVFMHHARDTRLYHRSLFSTLQCLARHARVFFCVVGNNEQLHNNWGEELLSWKMKNIVPIKVRGWNLDQCLHDTHGLIGMMLMADELILPESGFTSFHSLPTETRQPKISVHLSGMALVFSALLLRLFGVF